MKLRNIFSLISFLIVAVSCSMEDDVLNEMTKSETPNNSNQTEVYLSVNAIVNSVNTKASYTDGTIGEEDDLSAIETCSVILFENDKVIGAYDKSGTTEMAGGYKLEDARFLVKTGRNYEVYVIANTNKTFETCATKAAVEAVAFDGDDLDAFVKFGKTSVNISATEGNASASASAEYTTKTISVPLSNLSAQVRLMDVLYAGFKNNTNPTTVILKKVELLNQNLAYNIAGSVKSLVAEENAAPFWDNAGNGHTVLKATYGENGAVNNYRDAALWTCPTFPNGATDPVTLRLTFAVGSKTEYRTYIINRPTGVEGMTNNAVDNNEDVDAYVNAGFIYQLFATVAVEGDTFNCTIKCCTKDWLLNEYEVTMTEL